MSISFPTDLGPEHDWCLATLFCKRCGASQKAVAAGERAGRCEPGVTGISWVRAAERLRDLIERPLVGDNFLMLPGVNFRSAPSPEIKELPLYRLGDIGDHVHYSAPPAQPNCRCVPIKPDDPGAA